MPLRNSKHARSSLETCLFATQYMPLGKGSSQSSHQDLYKTAGTISSLTEIPTQLFSQKTQRQLSSPIASLPEPEVMQ